MSSRCKNINLNLPFFICSRNTEKLLKWPACASGPNENVNGLDGNNLALSFTKQFTSYGPHTENIKINSSLKTVQRSNDKGI